MIKLNRFLKIIVNNVKIKAMMNIFKQIIKIKN